MGETPAAAARGSADAISSGLDAAISATEGRDTAAQAAPAEPQLAALDAETPPKTGEESDSRVDPFWERAKSGKVTDNDREMVARWKRDAEAAKQLKSEMDGLKKSSAEYRSFHDAVRAMAAEHKDGEAYLKQFGPERTLKRLIEVRSKAAETPAQPKEAPPSDPERDRLAAEVQAIKERQMEEDFKRDLKGSLDGLEGLSPKMREYLEQIVPATLYTAGPDQELSEFVREKFDQTKALLESMVADTKAAEAQKAKEAAAKAKPGGPPAEQPRRNPVTKRFESVDMRDVLDKSLDDAIGKALGPGAA